MKELDFYSERMSQAKALTQQITDFVNHFGYEEQSTYFNEAMSREHRTLQQNFTRLVFKWIEYMASDDYRTDGRNADSKRIAEDLINEFSKFIKEKYHVDDPDSSKPSRWLGTV